MRTPVGASLLAMASSASLKILLIHHPTIGRNGLHLPD
jgi:hypothetical protein